MTQRAIISPTLAYSGSPTSASLTPLNNWVPVQGQKGGRNVIYGFLVKASGTFTTDGSTSVAAGSWASMLQRIKIWDVDGLLFDCSGEVTRLFAFEDLGRDAPADPASLGNTQTGQARTFWYFISFRPKRAAGSVDFGIPADRFVKLEVQISVGANQIRNTGGSCTVVTQNVTAHAIVEEDAPNVTKMRSRLIRTHVQTTGLTSNLLTPRLNQGDKLRSLTLFKPADATSNGSTLTSITQVDCPAIGINMNDPAALSQAFYLEGEVDRASTADPFVVAGPFALPVVWNARDEHISDCAAYEGQPNLVLSGNTVANIELCFSFIGKNVVANTNGVEKNLALGGAQVTLDTLDGTMVNPKDHSPKAGNNADYLPKVIHTQAA